MGLSNSPKQSGKWDKTNDAWKEIQAAAMGTYYQKQIGGNMKVICLENGPLLVNSVEVFLGGELLKSSNAALCRCGQSQNKPFCDGAHKHVGFRAEQIELVFEFPFKAENG